MNGRLETHSRTSPAGCSPRCCDRRRPHADPRRLVRAGHQPIGRVHAGQGVEIRRGTAWTVGAGACVLAGGTTWTEATGMRRGRGGRRLRRARRRRATGADGGAVAIGGVGGATVWPRKAPALPLRLWSRLWPARGRHALASVPRLDHQGHREERTAQHEDSARLTSTALRARMAFSVCRGAEASPASHAAAGSPRAPRRAPVRRRAIGRRPDSRRE